MRVYSFWHSIKSSWLGIKPTLSHCPLLTTLYLVCKGWTRIYDCTDWISSTAGNHYIAPLCRVMTRLTGWVDADMTCVLLALLQPRYVILCPVASRHGTRTCRVGVNAYVRHYTLCFFFFNNRLIWLQPDPFDTCKWKISHMDPN